MRRMASTVMCAPAPIGDRNGQKTSQMCPKICTSSLQLGVEFSTKRLKTCQEPITTMPLKIAATNSSIEPIDRCE